MSTLRTRPEQAHPTAKTYVAVALILAIITVAEFTAVYMDSLDPVIVPILLALSAGKFALVVMFYMHLKFDSRLFSAFFVGGLLLMVGIFVALMALFGRIGT